MMPPLKASHTEVGLPGVTFLDACFEKRSPV